MNITWYDYRDKSPNPGMFVALKLDNGDVACGKVLDNGYIAPSGVEWTGDSKDGTIEFTEDFSLWAYIK